MMHAFTWTYAKFSYQWNVSLQIVNYCVINKKFNIRTVFPYVLSHLHSFLFRSLCNVIEGTSVLRPADMLDFVFSGTHFEELYVSTVDGMWRSSRM